MKYCSLVGVGRGIGGATGGTIEGKGSTGGMIVWLITGTRSVGLPGAGMYFLST